MFAYTLDATFFSEAAIMIQNESFPSVRVVDPLAPGPAFPMDRFVIENVKPQGVPLLMHHGNGSKET